MYIDLIHPNVSDRSEDISTDIKIGTERGARKHIHTHTVRKKKGMLQR